MVHYGKKNAFEASSFEDDNTNSQNPFDFSNQLLTIQIKTGIPGPAHYHRSLLKGLLTLITYQHNNNIVYSPSDGAYVRLVLNFMQQLTTDDCGSDYRQLKEALGITEKNGGGKTIKSILTNER